MSVSTRRIILFGASGALAFAFLVAAYEAVALARYRAWKAEFDNAGWFGTVTVPSSNPQLLWEYRPYGEFKDIKTNRYGFRDHDYESEVKPDGKYRVAFVGDSVTLGLGVRGNETFVARIGALEPRRVPAMSIQAMNFGVDGYNVTQIYELLVSRAARFSPDEVIYAMCLNDFDFWGASGLKIRYFRKPRSFFIEMVERAYVRSFNVDYHRYYFEKNRQAVYDYVRRMQEFSDDNGIRFRVAVLPVFHLEQENFENYQLQDVHSNISAQLTSEGVETIDLLPAFRADGRSPQELSNQSAWHPSAAGHELIANSVLDSYQ